MSTQRCLISATALASSMLLGGVPPAWGNEPAVATPPGGAASAAALPVTVDNDNLWNLAARVSHDRRLTRQQVMVALLRRNPDAFVQGNMHLLRRGVTLALPSAEDIAAEDAARSASLVARHLEALERGAAATPLPALNAGVPGARPGGPVAVAPGVPPDRPGPTVPRVSPAPAVPPASPSGMGSGGGASNAAAVASSPREPVAPAASTAPAVSVAPAVSATPAVSGPAAPAVDSAPAGSPPWVRLLPYAMAVLLVGLAGYLWSQRRARVKFEDSVVSSFFDENGVRRPSRPKVIDVSQAGVEMARTVETLQSAAEMVRGRGASAPQLPVGDDPYRQATIKLEMARTSLEIGRIDAARALLQAVQREGRADQQLAAGELLAGLAPA